MRTPNGVPAHATHSHPSVRKLLQVVAACVLLAIPTIAISMEQRIDLLGDPAPGNFGRPVQIGAGTRSVTVEGGETIRFESNGTSFSWSFSGPLSVTSFNLRRVAPPGVLDRDVIVYIRPNPLYIGPS